jgi:hypothetical protein
VFPGVPIPFFPSSRDACTRQRGVVCNFHAAEVDSTLHRFAVLRDIAAGQLLKSVELLLASQYTSKACNFCRLPWRRLTSNAFTIPACTAWTCTATSQWYECFRGDSPRFSQTCTLPEIPFSPPRVCVVELRDLGWLQAHPRHPIRRCEATLAPQPTSCFATVMDCSRFP